MPISTSDLRIFASANMPEDDTSLSGGAIDRTTTLKAMTLSGATIPRAVSTNAADNSQTVTITGRDNSGAIVSDNVNLNGTTQQAFTTTFNSILKIQVSASTTGKTQIYESNGTTLVVTIDTDDTTNGTLNNRRPFYAASSDPGNALLRYEKVYIYNDHDTLTHIGVSATLSSDPQDVVTIGVEASANQSTTNRLTAPSSVTFSDPSVIDGDLAPNSGLGIWIEYSLGAAQSGFESTFGFQYAGQSV